MPDQHDNPAFTEKYTIEVPMYSAPMDRLAEINRLDGFKVIVYAGVPDSPLNGGRPNYMLDWTFMWDRLFFRITQKQLDRLMTKFRDTVTQANRNGMSALVTFTNLFVSKREITEENLSPLKFLVRSGQEHGVKNGVIVCNKYLEDVIRRRHGGDLLYVASCTKYVVPGRVLSVAEAEEMYQRDSGKYDYIVLTPQHSRLKNVISRVLRDNRSKIVALFNVFCSHGCNSYDHYRVFSRVNKSSLLTFRPWVDLAETFKLTFRKFTCCPYFWKSFNRETMRKIIEVQLEAGVTHFKIGRGFGHGSLEMLVSLIQAHRKARKKGD